MRMSLVFFVIAISTSPALAGPCEELTLPQTSPQYATGSMNQRLLAAVRQVRRLSGIRQEISVCEMNEQKSFMPHGRYPGDFGNNKNFAIVFPSSLLPYTTDSGLRGLVGHEIAHLTPHMLRKLLGGINAQRLDKQVDQMAAKWVGRHSVRAGLSEYLETASAKVLEGAEAEEGLYFARLHVQSLVDVFGPRIRALQ